MSANEITFPSVGVDTGSPAVSDETVRFQHFPALDGFRAIAILTVMYYHLSYLVPGLGFFADGGYLGVDIFFVLSGFLITSILLKEHGRFGKIDLKNFFIRRFLRLAPALWVFLLGLYLLGNVILPAPQAAIIYRDYNFAYAFFYVMNIYKAATGGMTGNLNHTWSLAIEEQFYIFWSIILFRAFNAQRSRKTIICGTVMLIGVLVLWRGFRTAMGAGTTVLYYSTETRIDALLIGCAASMIFCWRLIPDEFFRSRLFAWITFTSIITTLLVYLSFSYSDPLLYYGFISLFNLSIAIMILWLVTRDGTMIHKILGTAAMRWIGQISYSLYLWHYAVFEFAKKTFDSVPMQIVVGLVISVAVAAASYYLIERPFLRLKHHFEKETPAALQMKSL